MKKKMKKNVNYEGVCPYCREHVIKNHNDFSVLVDVEQKGFCINIIKIYTYCPRCGSEIEMGITDKQPPTKEKTLEELNPYITRDEIQEAVTKIWNPKKYDLRFYCEPVSRKIDYEENTDGYFDEDLVVAIRVGDMLYYQKIGLSYIPDSMKILSAPLNYVKKKLIRLQNSLPKPKKEEYYFSPEELEVYEYESGFNLF